MPLISRLFLFAILLGAPNVQGGDDPSEVSFQEKLLGVIPQEMHLELKCENPLYGFPKYPSCFRTGDIFPETTKMNKDRLRYGALPVLFRRDGKGVVYGATDGKQWFVFNGNKRSAGYPGVHAIYLSPDGRLVYEVYHPVEKFGDQPSSYVVEGHEGERFGQVDSLLFGSDGKTLLYIGGNTTPFLPKPFKRFLVVNGKKRPLPRNRLPVLGKNGQILAYRVEKPGPNGGEIGDIIVRGKRIACPYGCEPFFSPDGAAFSYLINLTRPMPGHVKEKMITNGHGGKVYDSINGPIFVPFSNTMAYFALKNQKWFLVLDQREGEKFDGFASAEPVFSPDGRNVAYWMENGKRCFVVLGDRKGPPFDCFRPLRFYSEPPVFSPHGETVAYAAKKGPGMSLVIGDTPVGEQFDVVREPVFSPRGDRVAYLVKKGEKWRVIIGAQKSEEFDGVENLTFSSDGSRLAFGAIQGRELWWKVMNLGD